jgi:iron complex outermembrane receptor protein
LPFARPGQSSRLVLPAALIAFTLLPQNSQSEELAEVRVRSSAAEEAEAAAPSAFVTVIEPASHPERVEDVHNVLRSAAGVQVRQMGGIGSFSTVSIRGSSSGQTAVFVDGVPAGGSRFGTVDLSTIPVQNVERIEIYRGYIPSTLFPSNLAGAVNIVTKSGKGKSVEAGAYYGSWNSRGAHASGSWSDGRYSFSGFAEYDGTDGNFRYLNDNGTPFNPSDDFTDVRRNNISNGGGASLNAGFKVADKLRISLQESPFFKKQGVPGIENIQTRRSYYQNFRNKFMVRGEGGPWSAQKAGIEFTLDHILNMDTFSDRLGETGLGVPRSVEGVDNAGDATVSVKFSPTRSQVFTLAGGFSCESYTPTDTYPVKRQGGTSTRLGWHVSAEDGITLFSNILSVTPALRIESVTDRINVKRDEIHLAPVNAVRYDTLVLPSMGIRIQPLHWLAIKGNAGAKGREPYFYELFGDTGFNTANPSLKAETGWQWDAGLSLDPESLHFEYAYFQSRMKDLIQFTQNSQRTTVAVNIGRAFISGHEFSLSWAPVKWRLKGLVVSGSYTYQEPLNEGPIPSQKGKQLPYRARHNLFLHAEYDWKGLRPWYEFSLISGSWFDPANLRPTPDGIPARLNHDAGIAWTMPWAPVTLSIECRNMGDAMVQDFAGYPLPGRSFYGSASFKL